MKIALHQFNPIVGDLNANTQKIVTAIKKSKADGCNLFITSELAICAYLPEDLLLRPAFIPACLDQLKYLQEINDITIVVGCPYTEDGVNYNSAFVIENGEIIGRYDKHILPNYGVFDEKRYFKCGQTSLVINCCGIKVGITICEDIWQIGPAAHSIKAGAQIICALNASPYSINKHQERLAVVKNRVNELHVPFIYVNQYGGQDELVFDGASFAFNAEGKIVTQLQAFTQQLTYVEYLHGQLQDSQVQCNYPPKIANIYNALVTATRDYVNKNGFKGIVLGLSGGVDSALTLAIAVDALGCERVMAVMMPSKYTADISIIDAKDMVRRLNVRYEEIVISPIFEQFKASLGNIFSKLSEDTTEENLQARTRGTLLMAISNKLGYLVLTTGNKSEMATGYATLYGDMAGGFAVLKDVLKTIVYELSNWRNTISDIIPNRIITRPPSAELRENQTDQDSLPDYLILDSIIRLYVEERLSVEEIISQGFNPNDVFKVSRLIKINEYKRRQAAVGPKITSTSFAKDWRYPITNKF